MSKNDFNRVEKVRQIIIRARTTASLKALSEEDVSTLVYEWLNIIGEIPTEWLNECYKTAMLNSDGRHMLNPADISQAWRTLNESGIVTNTESHADHYPIEGRACSHGCSIDGWIGPFTKRGAYLMNKDGTWNESDYLEEIMVIACPTHRNADVDKERS